MVDTKYKDHRFYTSKYKEHPSGLEWIGVALVLIGTALSLLVVAQRIIMGYYGVGLILVAVGSALMFHKTIKEEPESEPVQEIKKLSKIKIMLAGVLVFLAIMGVITSIIETPKTTWKENRQKMLKDKIDMTSYMAEFFEGLE